MCSKSLFFDPEDVGFPIIRYDYTHVLEVDQLRHGVIASVSHGECFSLRTTRMVQMKENNIVRPYVFLSGEVSHRFAIKYVPVKTLLDEVKRLWRMIREMGSFECEEKVSKILEERETRVSFDLTWMESLDEKVLMETLANQITPLVTNAGRLLVTNKVLYFQPLNNVAAAPVEKVSLKDCVRVIKRRHELRPLGIELFYEDLSVTSHNDSSTSSAFFTFRDAETRDKVYDTLTTLPGLTRLDHENQAQTTWKWQCGLISNFDYLMYLNSLAHRSFNDLTQYPVFPWILSDYSSKTLDLNDPNSYRDLSKPIGALNAERLNSFRRRYADTPPDMERFLYGTHYSTPAYVLYYLVRIAPEYMLKLQNGRFDEAERLFNSIADTWQNVLTNSADLKELIPEFFSSELGGRQGGEFLCNHADINFGRRSDGTPVGDVELPPWANDKASEFVRLNREALESDYVSAHLNEWIDLIFGFKQRGSEALKADNLFHPLTYEGAVDIEKERDPNRRRAILIQINEFGQTPAKIFDAPHPIRFTEEERKRLRESSGISSSQHQTQQTTMTTLQLQHRSSPLSSLSTSASSLPHYSPTSSLSSLPNYNSTSQVATLTTPEKPYSSLHQSASSASSSYSSRSFGNTVQAYIAPLSASQSLTGSSSSALWRNESSEPSSSAQLYSSVPIVRASPDPSVEQMLSQLSTLSSSPLMISEKQLEALESQLSSSSHASGPRVSGLPSTVSSSYSLLSSYMPPRSPAFVDEWAGFASFVPVETWKSHRQGVTSICLSSDGETLYSVSQDSSLKIYSLGEGKQLRSNNISQLALSSCVLSRDQKYVVIGSWDNNMYVYSNDYGRVVATVPAHDDTVSCLAIRGETLVSGSWDTSVKVWHLNSSLSRSSSSSAIGGGSGLDASSEPLLELSILDSAIRTVHISFDGNLILCGSDDGMLAIADIRAGSVVRTWHAHDDAIAAAQFTSDGRIISCSTSGAMKVNDSTAASDEIFSVHIPAPIQCMATNGMRLLTGDASSTLRTWDLLLGEEMSKSKRTPESPITCIATSDRADFFITGAEDGTLTKWASKSK